MSKRGRPLAPLELGPAEKESLEQLVRRRGAGHLEVLRAKVVLWAAEGLSNNEIVRRTGSAPRRWANGASGSLKTGRPG